MTERSSVMESETGVLRVGYFATCSCGHEWFGWNPEAAQGYRQDCLDGDHAAASS